MAFYMRNNTEYYVIEHRSAKDRDQILPSTGLAIWHIDTTQPDNNDPSDDPDNHYLCALLQADGKFHLEWNTNDGDERDLYGQNGYSAFPNTDDGADAKWWDGTPTNLTLSDIQSNDDKTTFVVSIGGHLGV